MGDDDVEEEDVTEKLNDLKSTPLEVNSLAQYEPHNSYSFICTHLPIILVFIS